MLTSSMCALHVNEIFTFCYYHKVDTIFDGQLVPNGHHLPSSQCVATDMVYSMYLRLKITIPKQRKLLKLMSISLRHSFVTIADQPLAGIPL